MFVGILCLLVFLFLAALMISNKLPALLALPLMAVGIALVGGIPGQEILSDVLGKGAVRLHVAFTTAMFGAMLAQYLTKVGITRQLIRWTAEYAGDNPFLLGLSLTGLTALLFTTLGGLGTVIMLGTVVLPVMVSVGVPAATAGGLFLMGINLGGLFNLGNWQLYMDVLKIPQAQIMGFVLPFGGLMLGMLLLFLAWEMKRSSKALFGLLFVLLASLAGIALFLL
ncbi:MAG: citrate transporter, partial [Bacteroidota bacterium]